MEEEYKKGFDRGIFMGISECLLDEEETMKRAYEAGYKAGYDEGIEEGFDRGITQGYSVGIGDY